MSAPTWPIRTDIVTRTITVKHLAKPLGAMQNGENGPHLRDLRQFVAACEGLSNDARVRISEGYLSESGRRDVELSVTVEAPIADYNQAADYVNTDDQPSECGYPETFDDGKGRPCPQPIGHDNGIHETVTGGQPAPVPLGDGTTWASPADLQATHNLERDAR